MKKRLISIVFALLMLCQLLSVSILATPTYGDDNEIPGQNWGNIYTVTLPTNTTGYTVTAESVKVAEGEDFSFTVTIADGYEKGDAFAVLANDVDITSTGVDDVYTIAEVVADQTITVTGVVEAEDDVMLGDVNGDGNINVGDVRMLSRYVAGGYGVTIDEAIGDVSGDGTVNIGDVRMLSRYVAGGYGVVLG